VMKITRKRLVKIIKEELMRLREGARPVNVGNFEGGTYSWYVWPVSHGGSLIGDIKDSVTFRREVRRAMAHQDGYGNLPEGYELPEDFHVDTNVQNDAINSFIEMYVVPDLAVFNGLDDPNVIEAGKLLVWPGISGQAWWPMWGTPGSADLPDYLIRDVERAKSRYHEVMQRQATIDAADLEWQNANDGFVGIVELEATDWSGDAQTIWRGECRKTKEEAEADLDAWIAEEHNIEDIDGLGQSDAVEVEDINWEKYVAVVRCDWVQ